MTPREKYAGLVQQHSQDAVLLVTAGGRILLWDAGAEALFGYRSDEAIGKSVLELTVPPDFRAEEAHWLAVTLAEGMVTFESLRRRKDGSRLYVCITNKAVPDTDGGAALILSSKKDVTQLRVQRDAQRLESKFRDLLENVPDAVVIVNTAGHIAYANKHAQRLFGYASGELTGEPIEALLPGRYRAAHVGHRAGYFSQPHPRAMDIGLELYGMRKDGSEFPVDIGLSPLQVEDATLIMSSIRDITDRKRIEQELRDKNLALENANRAKNRFLASMSHELRTPLNSIIGFTGTLLMRMPGELNAEQERQLRTVQTSARHLLSLINDLLDLAKIEAEQFKLLVEPVDCGAIVREVADGLRPQAEQKGLEFTVTVPREPVVLPADRRALSQILINLIENAIKFTDLGRVVLTLERPGRTAADCVEFRIEDTGPGIRPEDLARVFQPFVRFGAGSRPVKSGTGLGLHLSEKLATQMGGSIACESQFGRGSVFTLSMKGA